NFKRGPDITRFPSEILSAVLEYIRISDLLVASHACRAWRSLSTYFRFGAVFTTHITPTTPADATAHPPSSPKSIDAGNQRHWRLAVFRRYYLGRTFRARLPAAWSAPREVGEDPEIWPPEHQCGKPGGPNKWEDGDDYVLDAPQDWPANRAFEAAAKLPGKLPAPGSRLKTSHK
ncbi:hypothetical protein HK405_010800, partial [Cladochytrium tenue]